MKIRKLSACDLCFVWDHVAILGALSSGRKTNTNDIREGDKCYICAPAFSKVSFWEFSPSHQYRASELLFSIVAVCGNNLFTKRVRIGFFKIMCYDTICI